MRNADTTAENLRQRLLCGDDTALGELFEEHKRSLLRMIQIRIDPRLAGRIDPEDILQEAFLDARKRLPHYMKDPSRSFFVWLRLVTAQTLADHHRRHLGAKMRDVSIEVRSGVIRSDSSTLSRQFLGRLTSPSRAAVRAEAVAQLEEALDHMDPIDREVLTLRHFEELGNNEVAEILGMTKSAASNRYIRALKRLRRLLSKLSDLGDDI